MHYNDAIRLDLIDNINKGWALELHTLSSELVGQNEFGYPVFNNTYSQTGQILHDLKYNRNLTENQKIKLADNLALKASQFLRTLFIFSRLDAIVPVPFSKHRDFQPVYYIADKIGKIMNKKVDFDYIKKVKNTNQLKSIDDLDSRQKILNGCFDVDKRYSGGLILIFDDLYRSGATISEIAKTLKIQGKVKCIYVLCLTKTRTKH